MGKGSQYCGSLARKKRMNNARIKRSGSQYSSPIHTFVGVCPDSPLKLSDRPLRRARLEGIAVCFASSSSITYSSFSTSSPSSALSDLNERTKGGPLDDDTESLISIEKPRLSKRGRPTKRL